MDFALPQIVPPWADLVEKHSPVGLDGCFFTFFTLLVEVPKVFFNPLSMAHLHVVISTLHFFLLSGLTLFDFDRLVICTELFLV